MEKKELNIDIPAGYEIDEEKSSFQKIVFKKKENFLPKTWEEFCESHPKTSKNNEYYVGYASHIIPNMVYGSRFHNEDKNLLPSYELAEAMLALCQLLQLRDCYNDGWQPDWKDPNQVKYTIEYFQDKIKTYYPLGNSHILAFATDELRNEFLKNFKDLIKEAKPLL